MKRTLKPLRRVNGVSGKCFRPNLMHHPVISAEAFLGAGQALRRLQVRQHAGQPKAHLAHVGVGRVAELPDRAAAEHLRARARLDVDLHADHDLPLPSCLGHAPLPSPARQARAGLAY